MIAIAEQHTIGRIDFEELLRRCMGNRKFAQRIVAAFQEQLNADLVELNTAIQGMDRTRIAVIAHRIKGASSNVSAHRVSKLAISIGELCDKAELNSQQLYAVENQLRTERDRFVDLVMPLLTCQTN